MLAKIIAHGPDRATAVHRLRAALLDLHILGVDTNAGLIIDLLADETFRSGHIHTGTLATFLETWSVPEPGPELALVAATATQSNSDRIVNGSGPENTQPAWSELDGFRNARS
jgi:acetyl-CoA/propionyl-CoA carboxylase biotin carboxyl carrier protein